MGKLAVYLFLYIPVVWAALLIVQSLGDGLPDIITHLMTAMEHPFQIRWTDHSLVSILICYAAWATPQQVNAMFALKENKLLTRNVRLGLDTCKYRRDEKDALRLVNNLIQATTPKGSHEVGPLLDECDTFAYKHYSTGPKVLWALRPSSAKNAVFPITGNNN